MDKEKKFISKRTLIASGVFVVLIISCLLFTIIQQEDKTKNIETEIVNVDSEESNNEEELSEAFGEFLGFPFWMWLAGIWGVYLVTRGSRSW